MGVHFPDPNDRDQSEVGYWVALRSGIPSASEAVQAWYKPIRCTTRYVCLGVSRQPCVSSVDKCGAFRYLAMLKSYVCRETCVPTGRIAANYGPHGPKGLFR